MSAPIRRRSRWRWLAGPVRLFLALLILFEEWGWDPLQRLMARIGQWPLLRQVEALIARAPSYVALVVFFLPGLLLLPVKLGALWLMAHGQRLAGLLVIVIAKLVGTAIVARLFALTKPALMRMPWFARVYQRWTSWKEALLDWVRESEAWRSLKAFRLRVRQALQGLKRRWF